jgi:uncharacterized protein
MRREHAPAAGLPARLATLPIRAYQLLLSPLLGPRCRYHPTCSAYAVEAIRTFGILRGAVLAAWRLLRCNPWSRGGLDPVERQRVFAFPAPEPRH